MSEPPARPLALSLISHTNVGKTTLARTLLDRDVGEVRDAAHVTVEASAHTLQETPEGDRLVLWDTPGFGDSARLASRLAQQGNPIGWFLSQVWDRFRDRPLWLSQQAVRNVRDQADVVLYLVNAAEDPADAGYVGPEMRVLAWIGKPVVVLLNQTGKPRPAGEEAAEAARWRDALAGHAFVRAVLPLDAFARCWVQEIALLDAVREALPASDRTRFDALAGAWQSRRLAQFDAAIDAVARPIADAAVDAVTLPEADLGNRLREVGRAITRSRDAPPPAQEAAMHVLAERADAGVRASIDRLIAIHRLEGKAAGAVLARVAQSVRPDPRMDEGKAAMMGGVVSGALSGLVADLASGGLTLGVGMLAGGILGALGGAGIAHGYNVARGGEKPQVRWSDEFLDGLAASAILRYLAVAHYGRGRGEWKESEYPAFWPLQVEAALLAYRSRLELVWRDRIGAGADDVAERLRPLLREATLDVLHALYPAIRIPR